MGVGDRGLGGLGVGGWGRNSVSDTVFVYFVPPFTTCSNLFPYLPTYPVPYNPRS